ncbi:UDP-3-O-(3-hydroxymyristoyl)glucosamine N-acyltransferase [Alphaproteobacteria bacterium]|nr:UDP-3-O-(3-hydroxymyristoyl)glucosamine N-acyltransferase [Alphaproteobacteria bacterium]
MNKQFFKIKNKILLLDVLKILSISNHAFFNINSNFGSEILQYEIKDFVSFDNLKSNKLSFFDNKKTSYISIHSGFCLVKIENAEMLNDSIIKIPFHKPKLGFSKILNVYFEKYNLKTNRNQIHPTAIIHKTASIGNNVFIGAYTNIEEGVVIDDNTYIGERVMISYNSKIGKRSIISSGVFIEFSSVGDDVKIAPNTVIGKLGFGFVPDEVNTFIIPHIGAVIIGNSTNIGSGCTIDRGLIDDTIIGNFVMIDNQVHIGHNCFIDDFCILAGQVGLSGSVKLEKNVVMGGDVSIKDNVTIGENSLISGASKIFNSFPKNSKIGGNPAQDLIGWQRLIIFQKQELRKRKFKKNDS